MRVFAAQDLFRPLELIEVAIRRNPEIKALSLDREAILSSRDQSRAWTNPSLELGKGQKSQPGGSTDLTRITLSQPIPALGWRAARAQQLEVEAEALDLERKASILQLRNFIWTLIFDYLIAKEKVNHAQERWDRFRTVQTYLSSRVFAAPQKQAEATIVRSKVLVLGREFRDLEAQRKGAWSRLNLYLGLSSEPSIKLEWYKRPETLAEESLWTLAKQNNPSVLKQNQLVRKMQLDNQSARSERWSGLALNASFENATGNDPEKIYSLGVSLPLPVLNWNRGAIRETELKLQAESARSAWLLSRLEQEFQFALERYRSVRQSALDLNIEHLPQLEKDMSAIDRNFKKGQVDLLTYIEADAEHFATLNAILETQAEVAAARAALYDIAGTSMPEAM